MNGVSWSDIESITQGRFGRTMAVCPICSASRSTLDKRRSKVLAVELVEPDFAVYFCNHCEAQGYACPTSTSRVVDLAEQRRRSDEAKRRAQADKRERTRSALELFNQAHEWRGSPIEAYLYHGRQIGDWLDLFALEDIRFHPDCPFGNERQPCMVALVRDIRTDVPVAVHRTALDLTGQYPKRIERKSFGPVSGGAIKLSPDEGVHEGLLIGEGIETTLSASRYLSFRPCWSLIDKGHLARFPALPGLGSVTIAVDNDPNGEGQCAAAQCAERLKQAGIEVIRETPHSVKDFNDVIAKSRSC